MGRKGRPGIQRDEVIDAALRVLDRSGADGVTMRALATELKIQAPSLYWHFKNKQTLFDAVADRMIATVAQELPREGSWEDVLADFARQVRQSLLRYRDGARVFAGTYPVTENMMRIGDAVIGAVVAGGHSPHQATWAMFTVNYYVIGFVMEEQAVQHDGDAEGRDLPVIVDEIAALAPKHPVSVAALPAMLAEDFDRRFEFGLDAIVAGLRLQLTASRSACTTGVSRNEK